MSVSDGQIVAMGGGGFSMDADNLLDDFILGLSRRKPARVCFLPTASADAPTYIVRFYRAFTGRSIPTDLTLWNASTLARQPQRTSDLARRHGLDTIFRDAWSRGAVLAGVSAGMLCWFNGGTKLVEVVASRAHARAYRVEVADERLVETPLPVRFLGTTK